MVFQAFKRRWLKVTPSMNQVGLEPSWADWLQELAGLQDSCGLKIKSTFVVRTYSDSIKITIKSTFVNHHLCVFILFSRCLCGSVAFLTADRQEGSCESSGFSEAAGSKEAEKSKTGFLFKVSVLFSNQSSFSKDWFLDSGVLN